MGIIWGNRCIVAFFLFSQFILAANQFDCAQRLAEGSPEWKKNWDVSSTSALSEDEKRAGFLIDRDFSSSSGFVVSQFHSKLKTRIYHTLSEPDKNGIVPLVNKDAGSVVIYFHGNGTNRSGGRNFINSMQVLAAANVSAIGIDLPFHADGPNDTQFNNLNYFMSWLNQLINEVKQFNKPIYMIGHSFGPFAIQEYMSRYPDDIAGGLCIAAAGDYHPALTWTYYNLTDPGMRFIDPGFEDYENDAGGNWGVQVTKNATWMTGNTPKGKLVFLRGVDDEWFPENKWLPKRLGKEQKFGPRVAEQFLQTVYPHAEFIFAEGVGHYIFDHQSESGNNLILETLFNLMETKDAFNHKMPSRTARMQLASLYFTSPSFRGWIGAKYRARQISEESAQKMLDFWNAYQEQYWDDLFEKIPNEYPQFYQAREISWEIVKTEMGEVKSKRAKGKSTGISGNTKSFQSQI